MRRLIFLAVLVLAVAVGLPVAASAGSGQHAAITITANSDFTAPGSPTGCACVTAGNGTPARPYVIGPWAITACSPHSNASNHRAASAITAGKNMRHSRPGVTGKGPVKPCCGAGFPEVAT